MKKLKQLTLLPLLALCIAALPACKKGKEDPLLSLRSRKARLTKKWALKDLVTETSSYSESYHEGSVIRVSNGSTTNYTYNVILHIQKDGSYSMRTTKSSDSWEEAGIWSWLDGPRNKAGLELHYDIYYANPSAVYAITRLSNKELVLRREIFQHWDPGAYQILTFQMEET